MGKRFITFLASNEATLRSFGASLAPILRAGDAIALSGALGAGKTTLARGLIQSLLGTFEDVPSPTYTLVQSYEASNYDIWHCDLYRLAAPQDVLELGLVDMQDEIVSLIEWPEKMGQFLSPDALTLHIEFKGEGREVHLSGPDHWGERLKDLNI